MKGLKSDTIHLRLAGCWPSDDTFRPLCQISAYSSSDRVDLCFLERSEHGRGRSAAPRRYFQSESNTARFRRDHGRDLSGYEGLFGGIRGIPNAIPHRRRTTELRWSVDAPRRSLS